MDLKEKITKAVESNEPDDAKINAIFLILLEYFKRLYGNEKRNPKAKP